MEENTQRPAGNNKALPIIVAIAAIVIIVIGAYAFMHNGANNNAMDNNSYTTSNGTDNSATMNDTNSMPADNNTASINTNVNVPNPSVPPMEVKSFTVNSQNFSFSPSVIKVTKGDKVKITLMNKEGTHDLVIDEYNVRTKKVTGTDSDSIEFTADKAGTFEYYCSVGQHRAMGMKGNLIVQ